MAQNHDVDRTGVDICPFNISHTQQLEITLTAMMPKNKLPVGGIHLPFGKVFIKRESMHILPVQRDNMKNKFNQQHQMEIL
jgi:hypothetical protein